MASGALRVRSLKVRPSIELAQDSESRPTEGPSSSATQTTTYWHCVGRNKFHDFGVYSSSSVDLISDVKRNHSCFLKI